MLTETFVAGTENPEKASNRSVTGVHFHEFQPALKLKSTFKRSSIRPHCLAVSDTHVLAAQADKAVVHVYSCEGKNAELKVFFPEKVRSIVLAGHENGGGILIMGTERGEINTWELSSGRQVSTLRSHLEAVTCLAVDSRSNFLLSGSADSKIHLWALPNLLSFSASRNQFGQQLDLSPRKTLSGHREAVTDIAFGHIGGEKSIAVSIASDDTCIVWNPKQGITLHTFLLSTSPVCLTIDPADRAVYIGCQDGSIHFVNFFKKHSLTQFLHDDKQQSNSTQWSESERWLMPKNDASPMHCIALSYDGTLVVSGHQDGKVHSWNVGGGKYRKELADFAAPITNILVLKPTGFPNAKTPPIKLQDVVKPRIFSKPTQSNIPPDWSLTAQIQMSAQPQGTDEQYQSSLFQQALEDPVFPKSYLDDCLIDLQAQTDRDPAQDSEAVAASHKANAALSKKLDESEQQLREARRALSKHTQDDEIKTIRKRRRRERLAKLDEIERKREMGESVVTNDVEMEEPEEEHDLSSDTDELTNSD